MILFCLTLVGSILILCYRKYKKIESPTILITSILSLSIVIIFLQIISSVYTIYTGVGSLDMAVTGQVGDFIGGVVGTILTALSIVLLYNTLQAQNKSSKDQADQFNKSQIENRFFELLKFHRDNVNEIEFHYTDSLNSLKHVKGRHFFVTVSKQLEYAFEEFEKFTTYHNIDLNDIYEDKYLKELSDNSLLKDRQFTNFYLLAKIDICYLVIFIGVSKNGILEIEELTKDKYRPNFIADLLEYFRMKPSKASVYYEIWEKLYINNNLLNNIIAIQIEREDSQNRNRYLNEHDYYPDKYNKFYGGHQFRLGHYFRHLYQIVCYLHYNESLDEKEKNNYIRILRGQLSDYEQKIFFYNSISQLGRVWELSDSSGKCIESKDHLITNYNIIKSIKKSTLVDFLRPEELYSKK